MTVPSCQLCIYNVYNVPQILLNYGQSVIKLSSVQFKKKKKQMKKRRKRRRRC